MKYLFEITHPHFVHFFKNIIKSLPSDSVIVTCQDSGIITQLLKSYNIKFTIIGQKHLGILGKFIGQLKYLKNYIQIIYRHKIDIVIGLSPSTMLAAIICKSKSIFFDDDDSNVQPLTKYFTIPFAKYIITPSCLKHENYGKNHFIYYGYQELAYLAPNYFSPDLNTLKKYGLKENTYVIIRFNEFKAHHDIGQHGINMNTKKKLISILEKKTHILITTEGEIDSEFKKYQLTIDPTDIHQILFFAKMFIGDSQTMAAEAAVLGVPSIRCNTFKNKISYLNELEFKYNLTYAYYPNEEDAFLMKINEIMNNDNIKKEWYAKRNNMLKDMEDINKKILSYLDLFTQ